MKTPPVKVILDFDGTLTAEEDQVAELSERSLETLAREFLGAPLEALRREYDRVRARLLDDPASHCWTVNGLPAAYCDEGAFILNTTTLQTLLRDRPEYEAALIRAFPDPEYDPASDCTNVLFHRHTAEIPPRFRPGARELLESLLEHPDAHPVVLTNSMGEKVTAHLEGLGFPGLEVLGDTRQYAMDPSWEHRFDHPTRGPLQVWPVGDGFRVDLRRPDYYHALRRAMEGGSRLLVVADTFSLPGAVPLLMGIPFFLLRTAYTPDWCLRAVAGHPLGTVLASLEELRDRLRSGEAEAAARGA